MSDDQFNKLYEYMQSELQKARTESNRRFDQIDTRLERVIDALDSMAKQQEIDQHERVAIGHQLSRHEEWIERAAGQLKIKYDHGA